MIIPSDEQIEVWLNKYKGESKANILIYIDSDPIFITLNWDKDYVKQWVIAH